MRHLTLRGHAPQDVRDFWTMLRRGDLRGLLLAPSRNTALQLFRYILTGAFSFLVDYLLLFLLEGLGVHYLPAAATAFATGTACNFLLTKFFAFRSVDAAMGPAAEVGVFLLISGVGLALTVLLMYAFTHGLGLYFMLSKLLSSLLVFLWNFLGRKCILYPGRGK